MISKPHESVILEDIIDDNIRNLEEPVILPDVKVSISGIGLSWSGVVRDVCRQAGLSVLIPDGFNDITIDVDFDSTKIGIALNELTKTVGGLGYRCEEETILFDSSVVQSVATIDPQYADIDELKAVIKDVVDEEASVSISSGMIVVGGSSSLIEQSQTIANLVGYREPALWQVQICILNMIDSWQHELGINADIGGVVRLADEENNILDAVLNGYWNVSYGGGIDAVVLRSSLVILEGSEATIESIEEIPVPQRTVSPEGTVSISGYESISSGITVNLEAIKVPSGLRVVIKPEVSDLVRFVDERPLIARRNLSTSVIVQDKDVILLSGLWGNRKYDKFGSILSLDSGISMSEWLVCARFIKIK